MGKHNDVRFGADFSNKNLKNKDLGRDKQFHKLNDRTCFQLGLTYVYLPLVITQYMPMVHLDYGALY